MEAATWESRTREARQRLRQAQRSQKHHADKRRREVSYQVGDRVLLATKHLRLAVPSRKFADRYVGPFWVVSRIGEAAVKLDLSQSVLRGIHDVFHVSLIRPHISNGRAGSQAPV